MNFEMWMTLGTIALVVVVLASTRWGTDLVMAGGLVLLMATGVVGLKEATAGFANEAILMIAGLFVVAAGLRETGGIELIGRRLLGQPRSLPVAQARMMAPVAAMSAFMNTTPIIAMYLPMISDWARRLGIQPSRLFMPLSFAGILGGQTTLIGTGSNLILMTLFVGFMADPPQWVTEMGISAPGPIVGFWGPAVVGVPAAILGMGFIVAFSRWLLPDRQPQAEGREDVRTYRVERVVKANSPIIGKSIEQAGLRNLPGLYLHGIRRKGRILRAVAPTEVLQSGDSLIFVGDVDSVVDLRKIQSLSSATDEVEKVEGRELTRTLVEAVVSSESPLAGRSVRGVKFRTVYNAAIIAVHRSGKHLRGKIGNIRLQSGDTLLLEADRRFVETYRRSSDFYVVSKVEGSRPVMFDRAWRALAILGLLVIGLTTGVIDRVAVVWLCGLLMVATRCLGGPGARSAINLQVLITIGAAMGIGQAVDQSGLAGMLAGWLSDFSSQTGVGPHGMLLVIFAVTTIAAQLMTNYGAAVIMFPIVMQAAYGMDSSPYPFLFTMMSAAGCNFLTPVTYQTNLMVYGPGGYRFLDFMRLGLPLTILVAIIAAIMAPLVFPFMVAAP